MSPSARESKITSRTGLISGLLTTLFSTQNLRSGSYLYQFFARYKLFQSTSPTTSPSKIERLDSNSEPDTDDTIAFLGDFDSNDDLPISEENKTQKLEKVRLV